MDVRSFTVGPFAENTYILRRDGAERAVVVDPGDEAPRLLAAIAELGVDVEAILLTHTHVDHVGAVAPVAAATGATVYCPVLEVPMLADIMAFTPIPGSGRSRATTPTRPWPAASISSSRASRSTSCSRPDTASAT